MLRSEIKTNKHIHAHLGKGIFLLFVVKNNSHFLSCWYIQSVPQAAFHCYCWINCLAGTQFRKSICPVYMKFACVCKKQSGKNNLFLCPTRKQLIPKVKIIEKLKKTTKQNSTPETMWQKSALIYKLGNLFCFNL